MSSRQEEKERRRRERLERERDDRRKAGMRRRVQLTVGGVVIAVAVVALAIALGTSGGGGGRPSASASVNVPIPAQTITDMNAAARAAGCTVRTYVSEGREHLPSDSAVNNNYKTNPPSSGAHRPTPAPDGRYVPGNEPAKEAAVHALEHGRIEIEYAPGTTKRVRDELATLFKEKFRGVQAYHQLLFENNTNMPFKVAAVAWTHVLGCKTMNAKVFDAIRTFRSRYVDKGPELIP